MRFQAVRALFRPPGGYLFAVLRLSQTIGAVAFRVLAVEHGIGRRGGQSAYACFAASPLFFKRQSLTFLSDVPFVCVVGRCFTREPAGRTVVMVAGRNACASAAIFIRQIG